MGFWDWLNEQNKKAQAANQTANTSRAPQQQQARQQNQQRQAQQRQQQARQQNSRGTQTRGQQQGNKQPQSVSQNPRANTQANGTWQGLPGIREAVNNVTQNRQNQQAQTMQNVVTLAQAAPTANEMYKDATEMQRARQDVKNRFSMPEYSQYFLRGSIGQLTERELDTLVYLARVGREDWSKNNYSNLYAQSISEEVNQRQNQAYQNYLENEASSPVGKAATRTLLGAENLRQNMIASPQYAEIGRAHV